MKSLTLALFLIIVSLTAGAQPMTGMQAPEWSLPGIAGDTVSLSSLRGKLIIVDFWASWCGPCRRNNPRLAALYKKYHPKGLEIVGISLDTKESDWIAAVRHDRLPWIQVIDKRGGESRTALDYGVDAIPATFLVDKNGQLMGPPIEGAALESELKRLLN